MMANLLASHGEVREFLLHYLERDLPLLKRLQFRLHLLMCPGCSTYLRRYRASVELAQAYLDDPPPPELVDLTLKFLEDHQQPTSGGLEPSRH